MNQLEEKLRIIRNRKAILRHQISEETNRKKLMSLTRDMQTVIEEETSILKQLGVIYE